MMTVNWASLKTHAPNELQMIPLAFVQPSEENVRLFIERESLAELRDLYRRHNRGESVVLPDAPIIRFQGWQEKRTDYKGFYTTERIPSLQILAGERRLTAATLEEVQMLPCRVVTMTDEEAYRFILAHNDVAVLSTVELAYRAAEMDRLGFTREEISAALKGASEGRYLTVGQMIDPEWFTDEPKLCNPSIIEWFEAAQFGQQHFTECFKAWNAGLWDEKQCAKMFRQRGSALPLDNAERGFRVTRHNNRLVIRGQVDLNYVDPTTANEMLIHLTQQIGIARADLLDAEDFGARSVININPTTISLPELDDDAFDDEE